MGPFFFKLFVIKLTKLCIYISKLRVVAINRLKKKFMRNSILLNGDEQIYIFKQCFCACIIRFAIALKFVFFSCLSKSEIICKQCLCECLKTVFCIIIIIKKERESVKIWKFSLSASRMQPKREIMSMMDMAKWKKSKVISNTNINSYFVFKV